MRRHKHKKATDKSIINDDERGVIAAVLQITWGKIKAYKHQEQKTQQHHPHPFLQASLSPELPSKLCCYTKTGDSSPLFSTYSPALQSQLHYACLIRRNLFCPRRPPSPPQLGIIFWHGCSKPSAAAPGPRHSRFYLHSRRCLTLPFKKADYDLTQAQLEGTARLNVLINRPALIPSAPAQAIREDDDFTGEIPPEVKVFSSRFAGLPQGIIARIFSNKFRPKNLY